MGKIFLRNTIGFSVTNTGFSSVFQEMLDNEEEVDIIINSPGGSVFMGLDIFNEIRTAIKDGATIRTHNSGLAASMASLIFGAAEPENRFLAENSLTMIHYPSGFAFGNKDDLKKEMNVLQKITDIGSEMYSKITGKDAGFMDLMMKEETWYNAKEAAVAGFAPQSNITDGGKPVEKVEAVNMKADFKNVPEYFNSMLCFKKDFCNLSNRSNVISTDLTRMTNEQIREKIWKNYMTS